MDSPRYTIIVPMARYHAGEPVLASLRATPPPNDFEVIVAQGNHPSRQRNAALARARGKVVLFLDNDCSLAPGYWQELAGALDRPGVEIVGGPALLRPGATAWETIFHALLTHTLLVGTVASRYAPRGIFRPATQTDLILCNLAVRREIFDRIGALSTDLYPNEENEWLDRAQARAIGAFYDPDLRVYRPQRSTPGQMALALLRYGIGRTRQFRISGWRPTFHQFLPLMVLAAAAAVIWAHLETAFVVLWFVAAAVIALTCDSSLRGWRRIAAGLLAPLVPLTYSLGQLVGWFWLLLPAPAVSQEIVLLNERGEPLPEP